MIHTNTPEHIRKLQCKLILQLTPQQRGQMGMEMVKMARLAVENRIKKEYPHSSAAEQKAEIFRCIYKNDFSPEKMEKIMAAIIRHHSL
ncbi:MAG: hypothetical protein ACKVTZ_01890 [Bacteroidia bacterium]